MMGSFWCRQCGEPKERHTRHQKVCYDCQERNKEIRILAQKKAWEEYRIMAAVK